eukprot:29967_1
MGRRKKSWTNKFYSKKRTNGGHQHGWLRKIRARDVRGFLKNRKKTFGDRQLILLSGFHGDEGKNMIEEYPGQDIFIPDKIFAEIRFWFEDKATIEKLGLNNVLLLNMNDAADRERLNELIEEQDERSILHGQCWGAENAFYEHSQDIITLPGVADIVKRKFLRPDIIMSVILSIGKKCGLPFMPVTLSIIKAVKDAIVWSYEKAKEALQKIMKKTAKQGAKRGAKVAKKAWKLKDAGIGGAIGGVSSYVGIKGAQYFLDCKEEQKLSTTETVMTVGACVVGGAIMYASAPAIATGVLIGGVSCAIGAGVQWFKALWVG